MKQELVEKIDAFLKDRRESSGGGWAQITNQDIDDLHHIIMSLVREKCEPDADGDYPIEVCITNRRTHDRLQYSPVRYDHKKVDGIYQELTEPEKIDRFQDLLYNLEMATSAVHAEVRNIEREYFYSKKK